MLKQYNLIKNAGVSLDCRGGVSLNCSGGVSLTGISNLGPDLDNIIDLTEIDNCEDSKEIPKSNYVLGD